MTYAQNTPIFKEAQRTFSRGKIQGTVSADYEPTPMTYHASFWRQYRWHMLGYTLYMFTLVGALLLGVMVDVLGTRVPDLPVGLQFGMLFAHISLACHVFLSPFTLFLLPAPIIWYRRWLAIASLAEPQLSTHQDVLTSLA